MTFSQLLPNKALI
jgi:hypothetical protein